MAVEPDRSPAAGRASAARLLLVVLLLSLLWRVPSFFDPPWVNDEGTYFAVAQAMAHGYHLYADIWENKPPALYLMYSAVYHLAGPSLLTVRLLATLAVLGLVLLTYGLSRSYVPASLALGAALATGLLFAVPFLEGTTANAETFLAFGAALGVFLALKRDQPAASGLILGIAVLFKVVAAFDLAALVLWFLWHRSWSAIWIAVGAVLTLVVAGAICWAAGILPAMVRDALIYDFGYVGHANGAGLPWLLAVKVAALLLATWWLRRAPFPALWLLYAIAGALASGRIFGHYALQAVVPLSVTAAILLQRRTWPAGRLVTGMVAVFALLAVGSAAIGWALAASGHDSILARRLQYYANFARLAVGQESYAMYRSQIDDHVTRNLVLASRVRQLPPGRLLIWGNIPWVYVLSQRLPATPYTSSLRQPEVPGETSSLRRSVRSGVPREVIVVYPPLPPLGPAASDLSRGYRTAAHIGNAVIYVRRRAR